jgi:transcriptional regulator with XRE-family HTH domain
MTQQAAEPGGGLPFVVGDRLRKAREHSGLDQQTFAAELGVSRDLIRKAERSANPPKQHILMAWAMRTGVSVEWLKGSAPPPDDTPKPPKRPRSESNRRPTAYNSADRVRHGALVAA